MPEIEFDPVDSVTTGSIGPPGQRIFYLHATKETAALTVKLEKEQVGVLAIRLGALLDDAGVEAEATAETGELAPPLEGDIEPLFRAVAIGIGYDPSRQLVVLELHERAVGGEEEGRQEDDEDEDAGILVAPVDDVGESYVARLYLTPTQARGISARGVAAVSAGRPMCPLCRLPIDPAGHRCPATNGHRSAASDR